jgi:hypothetical protein
VLAAILIAVVCGLFVVVAYLRDIHHRLGEILTEIRAERHARSNAAFNRAGADQLNY